MSDALELLAGAPGHHTGRMLIVHPDALPASGGRKWIVAPDGSAIARSWKPQRDGTVLKALARAWRWQRLGVHASVASWEVEALSEKPAASERVCFSDKLADMRSSFRFRQN
jgi:hypothetical protein